MKHKSSFPFLIGLFVLALAASLALPSLLRAQEGPEPTTSTNLFLPLLSGESSAVGALAAWRGEYFANRDLSGAPVLVRNEESLAFDWEERAPAGELPADNFSARWTGSFDFDSGSYRFRASADDGVRAYVDGHLVIDAWETHGRATESDSFWLDSGAHTLRVEYHDREGKAGIDFTWERVLSAPAQSCTDLLLNGGFESNSTWIFRSNPVLAGYATAPALQGQRSLRTGIPPAGSNVESYSPAEQAVTIPHWITSAELRFSRYSVWGETGRAADDLPALDQMPRTLDELKHHAFPSDFFYVIAIRSNGAIDWLWRSSVHDPSWREVRVDLRSYAGQSIRLQFGTYNNGVGGISRTYIDLVSLVICPSTTVTSTPTATATATRTPTATLTPIPGTGCSDLLINGGFEDNNGWHFPNNPVLAGYATDPKLGGSRSLRTGIPAGGHNVESYSPVQQTLSIPAGARSAQLRFSRYNVWADAEIGREADAMPDLAAMPRTLDELAAASFPSDFFYVIVIRSNGTIDWLMSERSNAQSWRETVLDVSRYAGETVKLQFGTYNNGVRGISRTFVDGASLVYCPSASTSTPTATATPTKTPTATATTVPVSCGDVLINGGFEANAGWHFPNNPVLAGYATAPTLSGARSMRTGIFDGVANVESYSPAQQTIAFPTDTKAAQLRFSRYNIWGDAHLGRTADFDTMAMPGTLDELTHASFPSDFFYVILIRDDGSIHWLLREQIHNTAWRERVIDVSGYAGKTVKLQFGTYNNGKEGRSRTFIDGASLQLCR